MYESFAAADGYTYINIASKADPQNQQMLIRVPTAGASTYIANGVQAFSTATFDADGNVVSHGAPTLTWSEIQEWRKNGDSAASKAIIAWIDSNPSSSKSIMSPAEIANLFPAS